MHCETCGEELADPEGGDLCRNGCEDGIDISGEWLERIGFERRSTPRGNIYWQRGLLTFYRSVEFCACPLPHIQTRKQMLSAIDVLLASL